MSRNVLAILLLACAAMAQAASEPSAVRDILASFASQPGLPSVIELAKSVPLERRSEAIQKLSALDSKGMSTAEIGDRASALAALVPTEASPTARAGLAAERLKAGDYASAELIARDVLRIDPKDKDALAIYNSAKGRGGASATAAIAPMPEAKTQAPTTARSASTAFSKPTKHQAMQVPGQLHILDDESVAPEPTWGDRIKALVTPTKDIAAEDLKTLRGRVRDFDIPSETISLGSDNLEAPRGFVSWIKNVADSDLPKISYGILPAGQIANYSPGLLGSKGTITINFQVRDAEPAARSAVLLHELYHYWDFELAKNPYPNVSYGHHSDEGVARREYDAYNLAALYWAYVNPGDSASPLSHSLNSIPKDTGELQRRVDALVIRRKDDK